LSIYANKSRGSYPKLILPRFLNRKPSRIAGGGYLANSFETLKFNNLQHITRKGRHPW